MVAAGPAINRKLWSRYSCRRVKQPSEQIDTNTNKADPSQRTDNLTLQTQTSMSTAADEMTVRKVSVIEKG